MTDQVLDKRYLNSLVPVNALTLDHLETLLRDCSVEVVTPGQRLVSVGESDNSYLYLLSGSVKLEIDGEEQGRIEAGDPECRFPLLHHQPRRETVIANNDCSIIRFNCDVLDSMLAWDQTCSYILLNISSDRRNDEDVDWMSTLLASNLFYKVPPVNIGLILNKFSPHYFSAGETIIRQGELGDCCYVIKEGQVSVFQAKDERSKPEKVNTLSSGRCFGEYALVNDAPRNATIVMETNGVLMRLDKKDFHLLLKMPPVDRLAFTQAKALNEAVWLDVRTEDEYDAGHVEGALHTPLAFLQLKARLLPIDKPYIVYCNSGRRSDVAAYFLAEMGFSVYSLQGGFSA